jgi:uncharacterized surface protein with fasciclin (FAS1) repeats
MNAWNRIRRSAFSGAAACAILLAACSSEGEDSEGTVEPSNQTLAEAIAGADGLSAVATALGDTGLAEVFDGAAAYTLLAPRDAVFDGLGEAGEALRTEDQRPAMVALLRDHIVPGYLTPQDIAKAIELDDDGRVAMKTMAGHILTFSSDGGTLTATGADGATARFSGDALLARNGVAIPVEGLTVDLNESPAPQ